MLLNSSNKSILYKQITTPLLTQLVVQKFQTFTLLDQSQQQYCLYFPLLY